MTKPRVIFGDPIAAGQAAALAGLTDLGVTATYGTDEPATRDNGGPARPYLQFAVDGMTGKYPALATATVRITVWHTSEAKALRLAQQVRAVLLTSVGDADVRGWGEGAGPVPGTDRSTSSPFCTFTVAARLRPTPI